MNVNEAMEIFRSADSEAGYEERRYSACIGHLDGVVAIADESENGSELRMYTAAAFISWMREAVNVVEVWKDADDPVSLTEAVSDTQPEPAVQESH